MVRLLLSLLALSFVATQASAARLVYRDAWGGSWAYAVTWEFSDSGTSFGPDFVKYVSPSGNGIAGYELARTDLHGTVGGWAKSSSTNPASYLSSMVLTIEPDFGETVGDPITVYLFSNVLIDGPTPTAVGTVFQGFQINGVPPDGYDAIFNSNEGAGWHRLSFEFDAEIGDTVWVSSQGSAATASPSGRVADANLRVALEPCAPPDPPIASFSPCNDGIDNDSDGHVDFGNDPGCDSAEDESERSAALPCDDGLDNDLDCRWDYDPLTKGDAPGFEMGNGDPGCSSPVSSTESPACQDGVNNDGSTGTDFDGGESVLGVGNGDPNGADIHCIGRPWRNTEQKGCGLGFELGLVLPLLGWARGRVRRRA